jgi:hypothetical protein
MVINVIILVFINGYYINGCSWILVVINIIVVKAIGGYSNVSHWWLFY